MSETEAEYINVLQQAVRPQIQVSKIMDNVTITVPGPIARLIGSILYKERTTSSELQDAYGAHAQELQTLPEGREKDQLQREGFGMLLAIAGLDTLINDLYEVTDETSDLTMN